MFGEVQTQFLLIRRHADAWTFVASANSKYDTPNAETPHVILDPVFPRQSEPLRIRIGTRQPK